MFIIIWFVDVGLEVSKVIYGINYWTLDYNNLYSNSYF